MDLATSREIVNLQSKENKFEKKIILDLGK